MTIHCYSALLLLKFQHVIHKDFTTSLHVYILGDMSSQEPRTSAAANFNPPEASTATAWIGNNSGVINASLSSLDHQQVQSIMIMAAIILAFVVFNNNSNNNN